MTLNLPRCSTTYGPECSICFCVMSTAQNLLCFRYQLNPMCIRPVHWPSGCVSLCTWLSACACGRVSMWLCTYEHEAVYPHAEFCYAQWAITQNFILAVAQSAKFTSVMWLHRDSLSQVQNHTNFISDLAASFKGIVMGGGLYICKPHYPCSLRKKNTESLLNLLSNLEQL